MTKKMTNPTEPVNLRIERSPPPRLHLHTRGTQPAKIDNDENDDPLIATTIMMIRIRRMIMLRRRKRTLMSTEHPKTLMATMIMMIRGTRMKRKSTVMSTELPDSAASRSSILCSKYLARSSFSSGLRPQIDIFSFSSIFLY